MADVRYVGWMRGFRGAGIQVTVVEEHEPAALFLWRIELPWIGAAP